MDRVPELKEILASCIAVVGVGVTGKSVAQYLVEQGSDFILIDEKVQTFADREVLSAANIEQIEAAKIRWAIVSPGWKSSHPTLLALRASGAELISEIDFAWIMKAALNPGQKWVALTGTNGKTTTVQMVESIFQSAEVRGRACGNVGKSVVQTLAEDASLDVLALELSSFQIEWSELPKFAAIAVLNIAEDHIDWHGSFDGYANAKLKLLSHTEVAVLNSLDSEIVNRTSGWNGRRVFFSLDTPRSGEIGLVENLLVDRAFVPSAEAAESFGELADIKPAVPHNVLNAMAAAGLAAALAISHEAIAAGLRAFTLDHHRLELVAEKDGVKWINDSKATNPHAAQAALTSFESVVWIAGGLAKGAAMDELVARMNKRIRAAILIGTDRELIAHALAEYAPEIPVVRVDGASADELMSEVVGEAIKFAKVGDAVLLAPACASMDQFTSYAHRGDAFRRAVEGLLQ